MKNVKEFSIILKKLKNKNIEIMNVDFMKIKIIEFDCPFVYCDPPYILGTAAYNENNGLD